MSLFGDLTRTDKRLNSIFDQALDRADKARRSSKAARIAITRQSSLVFGLTYCRPHLSDAAGEASLNWTNIALTNWADNCVLQDHRIIGFVAAPRGSGKTTTSYLIIPAWCGAHQLQEFIWMGADSAPQAEQHLETLRRELAENEFLRFDYPEFCMPKASARGKRVADTDRRGDAILRNGVIFRSRGLDSRNLGTKIGRSRPGLMLIDDPEPGEGQYTIMQVEKRLKTLRFDIFPMGHPTTKILITGTPTRPDAIGDQLARYARGELSEEESEWIHEEKLSYEFDCTVVEPIQDEQSYWPHIYSASDLEKLIDTSSYARNFDSRPSTMAGWWEYPMFQVESPPAVDPMQIVMYVDPCSEEETGKSWSGWVIAGIWPKDSKVYFLNSGHTKAVGEKLVAHLKSALVRTETAGYSARMCVVETNQGGQWVKSAFTGLGVPVVTTKASIPKPDRARQFLQLFQRGGTGVRYARKQPEMWAEQAAYDGSGDTRDDILDAGAGACQVLGVYRNIAATEIRNRGRVRA